MMYLLLFVLCLVAGFLFYAHRVRKLAQQYDKAMKPKPSTPTERDARSYQERVGRWAPMVAVLLSLSLGGCIQFDRKWSTETRALEVGYQTMHAVDAIQTTRIRQHPELKESNPLLGEHPTNGKIWVWYMTTAYGHALITNALDEHAPRWVTRTWQIATLLGVSYTVHHNYQMGLTLSF